MLTDFINNLKVVAVQVIILYLISGIGFIADKTKIFVQADGKRLVDLLFNLILPIAIVNSFLSMERTPEHIRGLLISFALAVLTHIIAIAISSLTFRKRRSLMERGVYHYAITFSNAAFLALPLAQSVAGDECSIRRAMLLFSMCLRSPTASIKFPAKRQKSISKTLYSIPARSACL